MSVQTHALPPTGLGERDPRPPRRVGFSQRLGRWDVKLSPYLYISPFFLLFAVTGLFPLLYTAWVSVHDWSLIGGQGDMVGLENYTAVLQQEEFWLSLRNTFAIFLISSVPQVVMAIFLAALLAQNIRAKTFWRMGVLLPYVVAPVAVGMIFGQLFADQYGLINAILNAVGLPSVGWHSSTFAAWSAIATMVNFRWTGYNTLIFLAAMQAVPSELYEAAVLDGAGRVRQFFSVTVPQIRSTIIFVIITSTIGGLQIFDEPRVFDVKGVGGPTHQWETTTLYLYNVGWGPQMNLGRASAVAWMLFLVIVAIGLLNFLITRRISSTADQRAQTRKERRAYKDAVRRLRMPLAAREADPGSVAATITADRATSGTSAEDESPRRTS
ncbi:cellobiose ABC transporter membrane protein [Sediminihabitans luteus]|uniref:Cellobiose ABC transporter membrane protein n=1 Tax=Sediminihabitans luteus TaxID=1138585 RepID=A0A2M9CDK6_9CELL|nr:sugar ABC transporter permease [Sediminihabitans luteus]PJJ69959.1 cellobiose ABC transporter membrane protein [Sediminihabitans luteus]GII99279.1 sugar ABC transporter permease [Sediminihabitans luteus]